MFPPKPKLLFFFSLLILFFPFTTISSPYSSIAISHTPNSTLVCAFIPSPNADPYALNCTSLQTLKRESYASSGSPYFSAIAAGDGFLCALSTSSNVSTMRWWDFSASTTQENDDPWSSWRGDQDASKRVYKGPPILALSAGDKYVCAIKNATHRRPYCWRWPELVVPESNFSAISVGREFLCGLDSGRRSNVKCFGNYSSVVGNVPAGRFVRLAAGSFHACGVGDDGRMRCWGDGAPSLGDGEVSGIRMMALGENRTCVLLRNWTVRCWGEDWDLPGNLKGKSFVAVEAKESTVCGVLDVDFSLVCWGKGNFSDNGFVYSQVLPGACVNQSSCSCKYLQDSGTLCGDDRVICRPCAVPVKRIVVTAPPPSPTIDSNSGSDKKRVILIVSSSVVAGLVLIVVLYFIFLRFCLRKEPKVSDSGGPHGGILGPAHSGGVVIFPAFVKEFSLSDIAGITGNFCESSKIGSGSFGSVYRATLEDGRVVAVKRASATTALSTSSNGTAAAKRRRDKEAAFVSELAHLSRVNHKNLVRLIGYCREGDERALVYEYMSNGTLYDHLHKLRGTPLSNWGARLKVALDAARGIEYLHAYVVPPIIHRDIKSANILLDDTWTAKVSDFGLSLMTPADENGGDSNRYDPLRATASAGTVGYMDPEAYRLQHLTAKSDVYSFGVVLLELLTGCKAIHRYEESGTPRNIVEFAVPHIIVDNVHRILDPSLTQPSRSEIEAVTYVCYLAADCVSPEGRDRPTMTEVVSGLERALAVYGVTPVESLLRSSTIRSI